MGHLARSSDRGSRKVTPPSPTYMSNEQFAAYLADLRNNRIARPGGARPLPANSRPTPAPAPAGSNHHSSNPRPLDLTGAQPPLASRSHAPSGSVSSRYSVASSGGSFYYGEPVVPLKPSDVVPTATYMERGQRWMEKEEALSLRDAMRDMDIEKEGKKSSGSGSPDAEESRIYEAALNEAAELVWEHQHGVQPRAPEAPYRYRPHMRKDSYGHARAASIGRRTVSGGSVGGGDRSRSVSGDSTGSSDSREDRDWTRSTHNAQEWTKLPAPSADSRRRPAKPYAGVGFPAPPVGQGQRRSSMKRNISGEIDHPFSGDQIWEEPEASTRSRHAAPSSAHRQSHPVIRERNLPNTVAAAAESTFQNAEPKIRSSVEIHQNPPSQTRNARYTTNIPTKPVLGAHVPTRAGIEIRSDDIRQATSMKLADRSKKLPTPSAVSDSPGRPIVSFDPAWKAPEETREDLGYSPEAIGPIPTIVVECSRESGSETRPSVDIPIISVSDEAPSGPASGAPPRISVNTPSIPTIITPEDNNDIPPEHQSKGRALPDPAASGGHAAWRKRRSHWTPAPAVGSRATATCHECGFPIEGRFVALAGASERFHPQCFACYTCGTGLEALEISPEPDASRNQRLDRIARRKVGEVVKDEPGKTAIDDGDERLRFYCHLDWHELFAPRCKHCKTPILGEHVVALGEHWHYGHFFCAECGDPFGQGMTHIEKDGYAWCINCQTKRTERRAPKCRKCKKAVVGQYIKALGGEWHDECFRCATCRGTFDDGQIFPKEGSDEGVVLCTPCRAAELKA